MEYFKDSISAEDLEKLELASFPGQIFVIDTVGAEFNRAVNYLRNQKIIGFDTETRPCFSPDQPLCGLMANDSIIKVGAAVKDDIRGLQRYREFEPKGFIDLQKIAPQYGIKDKSVKKLTAIILGFRISKSQQLSNWEADTLSEAQEKYAATDAWVCREMYLKLRKSGMADDSPRG